MADKAWKAFERDIAKQFGTSRQLMKGTAEKADIQHPVFHVDCKLQQRWSIAKWFRDLRGSADKVGKIPLLVVREPKKHLKLVVCELHVFISLCKAAGLVKEAEPKFEIESMDLELDPINLELESVDLELESIPFEPENVQK